MGMKQIGLALALSVSFATLSACSEEAAAPAAAAESGIAITDPRMVLNAVSGRPAAIYFTITNNTDRPVTIRGASVANAESVQLHEYMEWDRQMIMGEMAPTPLRPGESLEFTPGGKHIMAMGISDQLQAGGTTEVTLNLLGGGKESFTVPILAAGSIDETPPPLPAPTGAAAGHDHN